MIFMRHFFQNLKNIVDFQLRQMLDFSRKDFYIENEPKEGLFQGLALLNTEKQLVEKYNLIELKNNSTCLNYLENLYMTDVLDRFLEVDFESELNVLDIGCKNWFYAKGEYFFFKKHCDKLKLDGIELDANRVYSNFYSRKEVAKYYTKGLGGVNYISGDFLNHSDKYDYIVWILPFVFERPLVKWGLPMKYFKPKEMLIHAYDSLKEGGKIFIINQGEDEFEAQKALCGELQISYNAIGIVESGFFSCKHKRYLLIINK